WALLQRPILQPPRPGATWGGPAPHGPQRQQAGTTGPGAPAYSPRRPGAGPPGRRPSGAVTSRAVAVVTPASGASPRTPGRRHPTRPGLSRGSGVGSAP